MNVNLVEFWTVQQASGLEPTAFLSLEDAQKQIAIWDAELDSLLERWKSGDYSISSSLIQSQLESDCEGGCYFSYHINDAYRPGAIYHHPKYSKSYWDELVNVNIVSWGNPVLQRPNTKNKKVITV